MQNPLQTTITRRSAIAGAAGIASAATLSARGNLAFAQATPGASATPVPVAPGTPLASYGINYDTGVTCVNENGNGFSMEYDAWVALF